MNHFSQPVALLLPHFDQWVTGEERDDLEPSEPDGEVPQFSGSMAVGSKKIENVSSTAVSRKENDGSFDVISIEILIVQPYNIWAHGWLGFVILFVIAW